MKKYAVREKVYSLVQDARIRILAVRFLLGKSYRVSEPVTRNPVWKRDIYVSVIYENSLPGVILRYRGLWNPERGRDYVFTSKCDASTLEDLRKWLDAPEPEAHRLKREAAREACLNERLYVIVRGDLPNGLAFAQAIHAARMYRSEREPTVVVLSCGPDRWDELLDYVSELRTMQWREPDLDLKVTAFSTTDPSMRYIARKFAMRMVS